MGSFHSCPFFRLLRSSYGNGDYIGYTYDNLDRVVCKAYNGIDVGCWSYNANGQVGYFEDPVADREYYYYYDDIGRPLRTVIRDMADPTGFYASFVTDYNNLDQTTGVSYTFAGQTKKVNYAYSSQDYWPQRTTFNGSNKITNDYDALGRLTGKTYTTTNSGVADVAASFGYCGYVSDNIFEIDRTTTTVESVSYTAVTGGLPLDNRHYTYDNNGNITCERAGASNGAIREKYSYDGKNQLVRHDSATQNKSFTYAALAFGYSSFTLSHFIGTTIPPYVVLFSYIGGCFVYCPFFTALFRASSRFFLAVKPTCTCKKLGIEC